MLQNIETSFDSGPPISTPHGDNAPLELWKKQVRAQFEDWLETIAEIPETETGETQDADEFSIFAELAALRAENRKGNRKAAEVFAQFGETLTLFAAEFSTLRDQLAPLKEGPLPRAHCLALAELLDRVQRLASALERPPKQSAFGALGRLFTAPWAAAREAHRQAVDILLGYLERLLLSAGLEPVATLGKIFDPNTMVAVGSEPSEQPQFTVLEEIQAGYRWQDSVLRPAEVKVSKSSL